MSKPLDIQAAAKAGWDIRKQGVAKGPSLIAYASTETHTWIQKGADLTGLGIEYGRHDLGGVHIQTDEASSLRHGRLLLCGCGPPRGGSRAAETSPHDRRGGPAPSTTGAGQTTLHTV